MWCDVSPRTLCTVPTCILSGLPRRLTTHCVFSAPGATVTGPKLTVNEPGGAGTSGTPVEVSSPASSTGPLSPAVAPGVVVELPQPASAKSTEEANASEVGFIEAEE